MRGACAPAEDSITNDAIQARSDVTSAAVRTLLTTQIGCGDCDMQ